MCLTAETELHFANCTKRQLNLVSGRGKLRQYAAPLPSERLRHKIDKSRAHNSIYEAQFSNNSEKNVFMVRGRCRKPEIIRIVTKMEIITSNKSRVTR
jgi:hypothetical protein